MFIAHKNVTERDAVPNTDRMQCASMTKHVVFEHMVFKHVVFKHVVFPEDI